MQTTSRTVHTNGLDEAERARAATEVGSASSKDEKIALVQSVLTRSTRIGRCRAAVAFDRIRGQIRTFVSTRRPPPSVLVSPTRIKTPWTPHDVCRSFASDRIDPHRRRGKRHVSGYEPIPTVETSPFEPLNGRSGGTGVWASVSNAPLFLVQTPRFEGNPGPLRALNRAIDDRRWKRRPPAMALPRLESGRKRLEMDGGKTDREA